MKIEAIVAATYAGTFGILGKYILGLKSKLDKTMTEDEIRQLIQDKLEPMRVDQQHIKEDVKEIKEDVKTLVKTYVSK